MSIRVFFEEIKKGLKSPVYLLCSDEAYLLKEALGSLRDAIPEGERDFTFHVFDAEQIAIEQVVDILYTVPLVGGKKTVAVEGSQKLKEKDINVIVRYMEKPSPESVLVLLNEGDLKKSHKEALKRARPIRLTVREVDIPLWIKEKAKGVRLTGAAIDYLVGITGADLGLLASEVEKLALSGKKEMDEADVAECVRANGDFSVFDLADALSKKDAPRVFGIYRAIAGTVEPQSLLGALNWHYEKRGRDKRHSRVITLLNEADIMIKTGREFPLEYLLVRLLQL